MQGVRHFARAAAAAVLFATTLAGAQSARVEAVFSLATRERAPLIDTLKQLVEIESGSRDIEGLCLAGFNYHSSAEEYVEPDSIEPSLYLRTRLIMDTARAR